jgi:hypothetical protein
MVRGLLGVWKCQEGETITGTVSRAEIFDGEQMMQRVDSDLARDTGRPSGRPPAHEPGQRRRPRAADHGLV